MTHRPGSRLPVHPRLMALAALLAVVSVGLPWVSRPGSLGTGLPGTGLLVTGSAGTSQPVRVIALVAAVLLWRAVGNGSRRAALTACLIATAALPIGLSEGVTAGRLCYALAIALAVVAVWRSPVVPAVRDPRD